jgi:hypothetical protein
MRSRRLILTIVFLLLALLLIESFLSFDFATSKNNAFTQMQKDEVEKMTNIDSVKIKAKDALDVIRKNHRDNDNIAGWRFFLIIGVIIGIILLTFNKRRNVTN